LIFSLLLFVGVAGVIVSVRCWENIWHYIPHILVTLP
jgi:hypothetical protein